jgi:hypothetical protein
VYDDDGLSTQAETHGAYFELAASAQPQPAADYRPRTFAVSVTHSSERWAPAWAGLRWEVAGAAVEDWRAVSCDGELIPQSALAGSGDGDGGGESSGSSSWGSSWRLVASNTAAVYAVISLPLVHSESGPEVRCTPLLTEP